MTGAFLIVFNSFKLIMLSVRLKGLVVHNLSGST